MRAEVFKCFDVWMADIHPCAEPRYYACPIRDRPELGDYRAFTTHAAALAYAIAATSGRAGR